MDAGFAGWESVSEVDEKAEKLASLSLSNRDQVRRGGSCMKKSSFRKEDFLVSLH